MLFSLRLKKGTRAVLTALLCLLAGQSLGEEALSLQKAVAEALARNPGLLSTRSEARAMSERSAQERALPNPVVSYGAMNPSDSIRLVDSKETRITVEQALPAFGKREIKGRLVDSDSALQWVQYRILESELTLMVRESAYDLAVVQSNLTLLRQEQAVLSQMEQAAQIRYSVGAVESMDVIRAQSETISLRLRVVEMEQREKSLLARLNKLLSRTAGNPVTRIEIDEQSPGVPNPDVLLKRAEETQPEIEAARLKVERASYGSQLAGKEGWPDFMISAERRINRDSDDQVMLMVGLSLPVWRSRIRAGLRESVDSAEAARQGLEAAKQQTLFDIQDACFAIENARRTLALNQDELIPQAEQRFKDAEAGYRTGKITFNDFLESERFLLQARMMTTEALSEFRKQSAKLDRIMGGSWEKEGKQKP